jgi:tetratricopeptide (TPR) repeat protein
MERKDFLKAEEQYKEIIKLNPKSANAYFNLGEIYNQLNDMVKARSYWRETLKIDPSHYGAKLRYYR